MQQLDQGAGIQIKPERRTLYQRLLWWACGLIAGALAGGFAVWLSMRTTTSPPLMRFVMTLPQTATLALRANPLLLSSDGKHLAYVAQQGDNTQLVLRELEDSEPKPIPGTLGAYSPFFSPDGSWIGYFDARDSKLKKVALTGGTPVVLCPAQFGLGASWGEDGSIIFAPDVFSGLWRIHAAGGKAEPVTQLQQKEYTHRWPQILPGGKAVIFTIGTSGAANAACVAALMLKSGQKKVILEGASDARFSPTGQLFFVRAGNLMAVRFDPAGLKVMGTPFLVKRGIGTDPSVWAGHYSLSHSGVLAYVLAAEDDDLRSLAWADRQGGMQKLTVNRGAFSYPRLSPDGRQLAVVIKSQAEKSNIWTVDLANGAFKRLTSDGHNLLPVWTPDGKKLTFASVHDGEWHLYWMPADGSGTAELLRKSESPCVPNSWSQDGRSLVFTEFAPDTGPDIWILSMEGGNNTRPYLCTPYAEWGGTFSPDGHWLAYTSNDSGLAQVYVQPYPGPGERYQISTAEGREPVWGHDGRELFFRYWKGLMEVGIQTEPEFNPDPPRLVVPGEHETGDIDAFPNYDVAGDGQRFVLIPHEQKDRRQINIDLNWLK
jgi:serine/threonine-protein kinase